ncbi:MAG: head-to-tail connector complex protein [Phage AS32]|nr:MAG: head-to-tail connector complex protein [Phage AS32]
MPYAATSDLLTGDIPLAAKYGSGTGFLQLAADEIDAQIGHIYVTPIVFDESTPEKIAAVRPAKLLLKKINTLLASGRIVLDMAAGGEDDNLHAYGKSMHDEAVYLLNKIQEREIVLTDAPLLAEEADNPNTGPSIIQEDAYSLVEAFYNRVQTPSYLIYSRPAPIEAYTSENDV